MSLAALASTAVAQAPSFGCSAASLSPIEESICASPLLSSLDRETARLYGLAVSGAGRNASALRKEQAQWLRERNACARSQAREACARDRYLARIAWLRGSSKAARGADDKGISRGPFAYRCDKTDGVLSGTFVNSEPGFLYLQRKKKTYALEQQRSGSGIRYEDLGESFREHQGEVLWREGTNAPEVQCKQVATG